jgi:hypothetical protein
MTLQEWSEIGNVVSGLAAAVALFVSAKTLKEIHSQREFTYKPHIIFRDTMAAFTSVGGNPAESKDAGFCISNIAKGGKSGTGSFSYLSIPAHNVGLGVAKNIEAKWSIDLEQCLKSIRKVATKKELKIYWDYQYNLIRLDSRIFSGYAITTNTQALRIEQFDHFLPIAMEQEPYKISMLPAYLTLLSVYYLFGFRKHVTAPDNQEVVSGENMSAPFPPCKLTIRFQDIAEKWHEQSLEFKFYCVGGSWKETEMHWSFRVRSRHLDQSKRLGSFNLSTISNTFSSVIASRQYAAVTAASRAAWACISHAGHWLYRFIRTELRAGG